MAEAQSYKIQKNESLSTIAAKYGVDWKQLAQVNDIPVTIKNGKPFALIQPGQTITIPPPGASTQSGKVEPPPVKAPPPPPPKPKAMALEPMWQSEYAKTPKSGVIVLPDPPPPPPPPTIKADQPPVVPGDEGLNFQEDQTPWWQKIHETIDPVRVMGNTNNPTGADYLSTALTGLGSVGGLMGEGARIAQPMAGTARDFGLDEAQNLVRNTPLRNLMGNRFAKMHPEATGAPIRNTPPMGVPKNTPPFRVNGRFVKGDPIRRFGDYGKMEGDIGQPDKPPFMPYSPNLNDVPPQQFGSLADILLKALSQ